MAERETVGKNLRDLKSMLEDLTVLANEVLVRSEAIADRLVAPKETDAA